MTSTPFALACAAGACWMLAAAGPGPKRLSRPVHALALFAFAMVTLGTLSYAATREFFPDFRVPIEKALLLTAAGVLATAAGVAVLEWSAGPRRSVTRWQWSASTLDLLVWSFTALALMGAAGSMLRIGYVPLLRGDIDQERMMFASQAGIFFRLALLGTPAAILAGVRWLFVGRSYAVAVALCADLVATSLYGQRFFAFISIAVVLMMVDLFHRRLRPVRLFLLGAAMLAAIVYTAMHRQGRGGFVFDQPALQVDTRTMLTGAAYLTFGEFRDFAWSLPYFAHPEHRLRGSTLIGAVVPVLPGRAWAMVGVDKDRHFSHSSATVVRDLWGAKVPVRVGLVGELYMNFGVPGVLLGMFALGLVIALADQRVRTSSIDDPFLPFWCVVTLLTVFALIGMLNMYTSSIMLFGMPLLAAALAGGRLRTGSAPAPAQVGLVSAEASP